MLDFWRLGGAIVAFIEHFSESIPRGLVLGSLILIGWKLDSWGLGDVGGNGVK